MEKTCYLFAGQGSQYPLMGTELANAFPAAKQVFEAGSDILGFDLLKACAEYSAEELARTEISQPAIMATSLAAYEAAKTLGITADMVAGHSLGEYAAMTAAGMLTLENAFRVIRERARAHGRMRKGAKRRNVRGDGAFRRGDCGRLRKSRGLCHSGKLQFSCANRYRRRSGCG